MPATQTVIDAQSLEFSYRKTPVLHDVSLSVHAGEVICLLGPNGVGKTTLVENLLGSLKPAAGRVRVLGIDPRRADADFWARVGLVQQHWSDHAKWRVKDQLEWIRSVMLTAT
ncbi:ATP-binding cassette domain-containing protein, partial [Actinomyces sp. MRS3W]|uniref:ATP-binding cassette domain-containing protein n=1 Tax=Actinomyces sp. MRS3W TaxID=2800796 RepID=UPI0028FDA6B7